MDNGFICLDKDILVNKKNYFFYIFPSQFIPVADLWKMRLTKLFRMEFEPIFISSCPNNFLLDKINYIIINEKLLNLFKLDKNSKILFEISNLDLNKQFSESETISKLIKNLLKKQKEILVIPYTTSFLKFNNKRIKIIGSNPKVTTFLDKKTNAYKIFKKLKLKSPNFLIFNNFNQIRVEDVQYPKYISGSFSSGSSQGMVLNSGEDLFLFKKRLDQLNINKDVVLVDFLEKKKAIETSAYVLGLKKTIILNVIDEISNGIICAGNIYPSNANLEIQKEIRNTTSKIGDYLSEIGYRGAFGCGFILDKNNDIYISDLNPRKQGFYVGDFLFSGASPIDLDIKTFINQKFKLFPSVLKVKTKKPWAYFQVLVNGSFFIKKNHSLKNFSNFNLSFAKNSLNKFTFWPENKLIYSSRFFYILGFGKTYNSLIKNINNTEKHLLENYLGRISRFKENIIYKILRFIYRLILKKIKYYLQNKLICYDPIIHIFSEGFMSLFLIDCKSDLTESIKNEFSIIDNLKKDKILFIGGGPIPYSAIFLSKFFKSDIDVIDSNWFSFVLGSRYIHKKVNKKINYFKGSSLNFTNFNKYDLIYFASQMTDKYATIERILKKIKNNVTIIVRSSRCYNQDFILSSSELSRLINHYHIKVDIINIELHNLIIIKVI